MRYAATICVLILFPSSATAASLDSPADWVVADGSEGIFTFDDGTLESKRRSYTSATILTRAEYENFNLSFEFKVERWCELIFVLHAPWNEAWEAGIELVLSDHHDRAPTKYTAGAILNRVPPNTMAMKEDGKWNTCEIIMNWPQFTVTLNETVVQDVNLSTHPELQYTLRRGRLGFRDLLGWGFEVRNWQFEPAPDTEGGIELYNGIDFDGWKEVRPRDAKWVATRGMISGRDGNGYLQHEALVEDFDLRLYYRTTPVANGGVFFRWMPDDSDRGNEIQLLDAPGTYMQSGSIYGIARANDSAIRPVGSWQLLQLRVRGNHCVTLLNGIKTAETDALTKIRPGHITLQMHRENATIDFKDLVLAPKDE